MPFSELVAVRTFVNVWDAEVARSALEAAGVQALVQRDDCGGLRPSLWLTGVALLVPARDVGAAEAVLSAPTFYVADRHTEGPMAEPPIYDITATRMDGTEVRLGASFGGRVWVVVNVASRCGYTPQYRGLEDLYRRYQARGLVVLGFPCNQFGRQEPASDPEIEAFCVRRYDVTFPLFRKVAVNGAHAHPLFRYLKAQRTGWLGLESIKWNFTKFLVDSRGHVVSRYGPADTPEVMEPEIVRLLDEELTEDVLERQRP